MSTDDESVRYDRQVRLWGKTTQQRLMRTDVQLLSVCGALGEVAKNLALAGVRSLELVGQTEVTAGLLRESFLLQHGLTDDPPVPGAAPPSYEHVCARALERLNPHVRVTAAAKGCGDRAPQLDGAHGIRVTLLAARELLALADWLAKDAQSDLVIATVAGGTDVLLALFFSRQQGPFAAQLHRQVSDPTYLSLQPAAYQAAALSLHLPKARSFEEALCTAVDMVASLQLHELSPAQLEEVAWSACQDTAAGGEGVVLSTEAGAGIAQQVVRFVGDCDVDAGGASWHWLLCRTSPTMDMLIG